MDDLHDALTTILGKSNNKIYAVGNGHFGAKFLRAMSALFVSPRRA